MAATALFDDLLTLGRTKDISSRIEQNFHQMNVATSSLALHLLARSAEKLPPDERRAIAAHDWFMRFMMRLGGQLAGRAEMDAQGLCSVLWALAALEQKESPLLNGLIKRLVLLAHDGRVNAPQLLLMAQSLAKLGLLGGPIGQALANLTSARLADLHAAQLGTLARCLTEALGGPAAEPLLRQMLASRLAEFTPEQARARMRQSVLETAQLRQEKASSTDLADAELLRRTNACLVHGAASMLTALAQASLAPPPQPEQLEALLNALTDGQLAPLSIALPRLAELLWALQSLPSTLDALTTPHIANCMQALRFRLSSLHPHELPPTVSLLQALGKPGGPALQFARERQSALSEQLSTEIQSAHDENALLQLLTSRPVNGPQLCQGMTLLARMVQRCPDPAAWAASITIRPDFKSLLGRLKDLVASLDAGYMREALCALADLKAKDPYVIAAFCEQFDTRLHSFTAVDAASCLWAFCALGLAQAPAYPRMMRSVETHLHTLPAKLLGQLVTAIVPLGRAAACSRLLPKLVNALATANPPLDFHDLLVAARLLCRRVPLTENLLLQMQRVIAHEIGGEGEGALTGNLSPDEIVTSIWLFVRHMPYITQQSPNSPLIPVLNTFVEQLLMMVGDLDSLAAEQICDLANVIARLQKPNAFLLQRVLSQIETRLQRNQLRLVQVVETTWALFELYGKTALDGSITEDLLQEIDKRARSEGAEQISASLQQLSTLPMRRPWPILEAITNEIRHMESIEPKILTEVVDSLARLRYDEPKLLDAVELQVERALDSGRLHEAMAASMIEAFGTLNYLGRTGTLLPKLVQRIADVPSLLPHSATSLLHGLALLHFEPAPPLLTTEKILEKVTSSGLNLELTDVAVLLWSMVELCVVKDALDLLRNLPPEMTDAVASADLHTLTFLLWSMLVLRAYDSPLLVPTLQALAHAAPGVRLPAHLCRLAECTLMLQLEAPQSAGLQLPQELTMKAQYAWQQAYGAVVKDKPPNPLVDEMSRGLSSLGLQHSVNVFNTYPIDVLIPHAVTGGVTFAFLLHPPTHFTSGGGQLGTLQLKSRLLTALGCVVLHVRHEEWNDKRTDTDRQIALREMIQPHMTQQQPKQEQ